MPVVVSGKPNGELAVEVRIGDVPTMGDVDVRAALQIIALNVIEQGLDQMRRQAAKGGQ